MSLKNIAIVLFCIIYFFFNFILFSIFNKSYVEKIKNDFLEQNKYSLDMARNYVFQEVDNMTNFARQIADDQIVRYAFNKNEYISVSHDNIDKPIKILPLNKVAQVKMAADLKNRLFGWREGKIRRDINFYDKELNRMISTGDIIERNYTPKYLMDAIGKGEIPGADLGVIEFENNEIFLRGVVPIHRINRMGVVEVFESVNSVLANEMKMAINREVVIKTNDRIITSTLYNGTSLLENYKIEKGFITNKEDYNIINIMDKNIIFHFQPLYNYTGEKVADIGVGFYSENLEKIYRETMKKIVISEMLFSIFILVVIYLFMAFIFEHFDSIVQSIKNISEGEYDDKLNISFGKELKILSGAVNTLSDAVRVRENELKELNITLESKVEQRTSELEQSNGSLKTLLDNTGQGILYYGEDLLVDQNYSSECSRIFCKNIGNTAIEDILFEKESDRAFFRSSSISVLRELNKRRRKAYLELLPTEIEINRYKLKIEYKIIEAEQNKIMLILTDMTAIKMLEDRVKNERNRLDMIVRVVTNSYFFRKMVKDFNALINRLENENKLESIDNLLMDIHTFKGNFSQLRINGVASELNKFEDFIQSAYSMPKPILLIKIIERVKRVKEVLAIEIETIEGILGKNYFVENDGYFISSIEIDEIGEEIKKRVNKEESAAVAAIFDKLKKVSLAEIVRRYENYIYEIANKKGKMVKIEVYELDKVYIDEAKYGSFINSLVHIFRNLVDHGIEDPEERALKGKKEYGKIKCSIGKDGNKIQIYISDDGAGIDYKKIAEKGINEGWIAISDADNKSKLTELIFRERFSVKSESDEISGRGIGLSAVKKAVESYFGNIEVLSEQGKGTEFRIVIRDIN